MKLQGDVSGIGAGERQVQTKTVATMSLQGNGAPSGTYSKKYETVRWNWGRTGLSTGPYFECNFEIECAYEKQP